MTKSNGTVINSRLYLGAYEKDITNGVTRHIHYISAGSGLNAIVVRVGSVDTYYYTYTDHLGSIVTVTNDAGNVVARQDFDAWGRNRNPDTWTYTNIPTVPDWLYRGYTGHEHLPYFGLINMNGRMYDPVLGRMLSVDNYVQAGGYTQSYNRYSYAWNNPLKYTDPDGEFIFAAFMIGILMTANAASKGKIGGAGDFFGTFAVNFGSAWAGSAVGSGVNAAIAGKGLMVVDCIAEGKAGHAAREEGINAIYLALDDLNWVKNYAFEKISPYLGKTKMTATIINAGSQHNVVPKDCVFTLDIRLTEMYSHKEMEEILKENLKSKINVRSFRLKPSYIEENHPLVKAAVKNGAITYGSPTTSDQALIPVPSLKIGPGDSARSHQADEFIYIKEIEEGIEKYIKILGDIIF